jgi:hypothetical protein
MLPQDLPNLLAILFGDRVLTLAPGSYQIETDGNRLLVMLSEDQSWLRILSAIAPASEAQPFLEELLAENFDQTQETRYGLHQDVLWGVFQHSCAGLTPEDFQTAIARVSQLATTGLKQVFQTLIEKQVRQIIKAAKQQGQSLEATLKTLERFYSEGVMGDMRSAASEKNQTLAAWRYQLERLWDQVNP